MRTVMVFAIGLIVGATMVPGSAQSTRIPGINNMNHVAIAVPDMNAALDFYMQKMGFGEGFIVRNDKGEPTLAYVQVSKDTFVELAPVNANRPAGLNHYGLHVQDLKAFQATLKQRGVTVTDVRPGGDPSSFSANVTDPNGINIELFQFGPESLQGKAIGSWK